MDFLTKEIKKSPSHSGRVVSLCIRPEIGLREYPDSIRLDVDEGAVGDRWIRKTWMYLEDGRPDPRVQVAVCNVNNLEYIRAKSGSEKHPGDTFVVDLDLSEENLPIGSRLKIGEAIIEVSDVYNDGCVKFAEYFGKQALAFVRSAKHRPLRLRGIFAKIIQSGTVRQGDLVSKIN
jgi:MOSC domain-containing protein YiiM